MQFSLVHLKIQKLEIRIAATEQASLQLYTQKDRWESSNTIGRTRIALPCQVKPVKHTPQLTDVL